MIRLYRHTQVVNCKIVLLHSKYHGCFQETSEWRGVVRFGLDRNLALHAAKR